MRSLFQHAGRPHQPGEGGPPLWLRVALPISVTLLLFLAAIFLVYLPAFRDSLFVQRKQAVRDLTIVGEHVLMFYFSQEEEGLLTRQEAQQLALKELQAFRYGPTGEDYYWVQDYDGLILMHPFRLDLVGTNQINMRDYKGNLIFADFITSTEDNGSAFVDYYWQKGSDSSRIEYKLSFVKRFVPWKWIIGTGMYVGDVEALVQKHVQKIMGITSLIFLIFFLMAVLTVFQGVMAGRRIRDSEARLRSIFDQTFHFIGYLDLLGNLLSVNKPALDFVGVDLEDVYNRPLCDSPWWQNSNVSKDFLESAVAKAAKGETARFDTEMSDREGSVRQFAISIKPVRDSLGHIVNILAEGSDITELKTAQAELKRLNQELEERVQGRTKQLRDSLETLQKAQGQLVEAEKMASLGGLVAGVAHEINTPLGLGVTSISFLEEKMDWLEKAYSTNTMKRSDLDKFLHTAREAVNSSMFNLRRAAQLIQSFKQVAVDQTSEALREFDVKDYLEEVLTSLRPKYKRTNHHVALTGDSGIKMMSYPGALTQVIANLLVNSLLHGFDGIESGEISISVSKQDKNVVIVFADNGHGMTEEQRTKIFEPFFTTRRGQGGSGLGMHIVYNLIHQKLGGTIYCESQPEKGAVFTIRVPADLGANGVNHG